MQHVSTIEKKIIRALLDDAASAGYVVSVFDGEEWTLKMSSDRKAIEDSIGTTDETVLRFRGADKSLIGSVWLVHGNDEDVISDLSDNEATNALVARASRLHG